MALQLSQGELFKLKGAYPMPALVGSDGSIPFILIGCGRSKCTGQTTASQLYVSTRFQAGLKLANTLGAPFAILSGLHGIVPPQTMLEPYDLHLSSLPRSAQRLWAAQALQQLRTCSDGRRISVLAAPEYASPLLEINSESCAPLDIEAPWMELDGPSISAWLADAERIVARVRDLGLIYSWIDEQRHAGKTFFFRDLSKQLLPKRGVYIFLDPREPNFLGRQPRIVRIGTHAVSKGSKTTLRDRLRNHLGPVSEIGNHRGSIFRLHVGRAMLGADSGLAQLPSWGEGQDAGRNIKSAGVDLALLVSRYLRELEVVLIDIDDQPGRDSQRARSETNLIALCSEGFNVIESPTRGWLGLKSPTSQIKLSGLWNIRGVGSKYDGIGDASVGAILGIK